MDNNKAALLGTNAYALNGNDNGALPLNTVKD
jgi:hypothetical protein